MGPVDLGKRRWSAAARAVVELGGSGGGGGFGLELSGGASWLASDSKSFDMDFYYL